MGASLAYRDAVGRACFGRTQELRVDLPHAAAWRPAGFALSSRVTGHPPADFATRAGVLAVARAA